MLNKKYTKLVAAMGITLFAGAVQAANVAVNGGFETGNFTGWTQFNSGSGSTQTVDTGNSSEGTYFANLNNLQPGSASLIKNPNVGIGTVEANSAYTITFDARGGFGFAEFFSELSGGGTSKSELLGGAPLAVNADPDVWTPFLFSGTTGNDVSGGVTLQFTATTGATPGASSQMFYDNLVIDVATSAVPVPAAVWLFGSGLLGLVGVARRKKALAA